MQGEHLLSIPCYDGLLDPMSPISNPEPGQVTTIGIILSRSLFQSSPLIHTCHAAKALKQQIVALKLPLITISIPGLSGPY